MSLLCPPLLLHSFGIAATHCISVSILIVFVRVTNDAALLFRCEFDWVRVRDGLHPSSCTSPKFCDNNGPPSFVSSSNSITIEFYSDGGVELKGYAAKFNLGMLVQDNLCRRAAFVVGLLADGGITQPLKTLHSLHVRWQSHEVLSSRFIL